jgi:nitroimidazol reductase NimA-like FMN-containing flavoprotein (pyridoxamine 5'-phosphate oxidase superfamily)
MPTDSRELEVLTEQECRELLANPPVHVGRVALIDGGRPLILPVNYLFTDGAVVFRTDPGTKLATALREEQVAFEVDAVDTAWREGWSVVVLGRAEEVTDADDRRRLQALPLRAWGPGAKDHLVRIRPTKISGRRIV